VLHRQALRERPHGESSVLVWNDGMSAGGSAVETLASPTRAAARTALDETIEMDETQRSRRERPNCRVRPALQKSCEPGTRTSRRPVER
jgi:hypothetical protein